MLKIIHSADWHLGKKLEDVTRNDEQIAVLDEFIKIVEQKSPDLVIIAGDIFDSVNPPANSEYLFYNTLNRLKSKERIIVVLSGNHDNHIRLSAARNLLSNQNIIFFKEPNVILDTCKYDNFEITMSYPGGIKINFKDKNIYINTLAYPTEANLNIDFSTVDDYSQYITDILKEQNKNFQNDGYLINIAHLYVGETSSSLGGTNAVNIHDFEVVDYTALGHIHKPMIYLDKNIAYSGSLLEYRLSENKYQKCVLYVEIDNQTTIEKIELTNNKPIVQIDFSSVNSLISYATDTSDREYIYATLNLDKPINLEDRKQISKFKNIVSYTVNVLKEHEDYIVNEKLDIEEQFKQAFYVTNNEIIDEETLNLFKTLVSEGENETN